MKAYIYQIKNLENGKLYIGSTTRPSKRFYEHRTELNKGTHYSTHLQKSWLKYGNENFEFSVIETTVVEERYLRERFWIVKEQTLNSDYGYNIVLPDDNGSYYRTEATNKKISQGVINSLIKQRGRVILLNLETGEESFFDSLVEMKDSIGVSSHKKLSFKNKTYWRYENESMSNEKRLQLLNKCETEYVNAPKKVYVFDYVNENFYNSYFSIEETARELNISATLIARILNNTIKSAKGYTFSYSPELPVFQKHRKDKKWFGKRIRQSSKQEKTFKYSITNGEHFYLSYSVPELVKYVSGTTKKGWQKLASGERKSYMGYTLSKLQ